MKITAVDEAIEWIREVGARSLLTELREFESEGFRAGLIATIEQMEDAFEAIKREFGIE